MKKTASMAISMDASHVVTYIMMFSEDFHGTGCCSNYGNRHATAITPTRGVS